MHVTLELSSPAGDRVAGTLVSPGLDKPVLFDGWLDLMRLLEKLMSDYRSAQPDPLGPTNQT